MVLSTSKAVLGFIIYGYYPGLMSFKIWWKVLCPCLRGPPLASKQLSLQLLQTALLKQPFAIQSTCKYQCRHPHSWIDSFSCRKAAFFSQWSTVAYTMIISDGLVFLVWLLITIPRNNGGMMHIIFFRIFQT
jgi:hypothetical protein